MQESQFIRPKITKFFEGRMLDNYKRGSFWFGTLKRYRRVETNAVDESVEPRFSDAREGLIEISHHFEAGYAKSAEIDGFRFTDCFFGGNDGGDITITHEFNDFVFCASWGAYSRQQHLAIKNGAINSAGTNYRGNEKLTHFAEIDLIDFLDAVKLEAQKAPLWKTVLPAADCLLQSRVTYGQTERTIYVPSVYQSNGPQLTSEDYLRTVFTKPKYFSPENEFRVVLRSNAPDTLEGDPDGMKLVHKKLRRSILRIGTLDGDL